MGRLGLVLAGVILGVVLSHVYQAVAEDKDNGVYVLVSAQILEPEGLDAYAEAAAPLALQHGLEILGRIPTVPDDFVFEGEWPFEGGITIERFESMESFRSFWNSDAYQAAIPLREGKVDFNFVVAVPAGS